LLGGICNWLIAIPLATGLKIITVGQSGNPSEVAAATAWEKETRFLGRELLHVDLTASSLLMSVLQEWEQCLLAERGRCFRCVQH
jgi:hypothetical protein